MIMQGLTKLTKRAFFIMLVLIIVPLQTLAEDRFGLDKAAQGTSLNRQPIEVVAANIVQVVLGFVGILFMVLIIYGGFQWMTASSSGEKDAINNAKKTLTTAVVGLIIIIAAYSITYYITSYILNASSESAPVTGPGPTSTR